MKAYRSSGCSCIWLAAIWIWTGSFAVKAQSSYVFVGSANASGTSDCYNITQEQPGRQQTGAIWCNNLLLISESFMLEFTANFGSNPSGADGMTLVMQTEGVKAVGSAGSGLGFRGLKPSLGIEFDTYFNGDMGDPTFSHMAVMRDGNTNHRLNSAFAAPVPILTTSENSKDGRDHIIKLTWNATTHLLQVYVDCIERISQSVNLVDDIFGGRDEVYWGVTASTGLAGNVHTVCLPENSIVRYGVSACPKDSVVLVAGLARDNKYQWNPQQGLDNPQGRTPRLVTSKSQLYTVTYTDRCGVLTTTSVQVNVKTPELNLGEDRQACGNEVVDLNPTLTPSTIPVQFQWSTGDTARQLKTATSGTYTLQISAGGCSTSDTVVVTYHPLPRSGLKQDTTYNCPGDSLIELNPQAIGNNLSFAWMPGGTTQSTLSASQPGQYLVKISTEFGCSIQQRFTILNNCLSTEQVFVPDAFSPNNDGINDVFEWKGSKNVEARMTIYDRWGTVLFASENSHLYWDGSCQGRPCKSGVYVWRLEYRSQKRTPERWFMKSGEVVLVR